MRWLLLAVLVGGCVESTAVMAPDGRNGFLITCRHTRGCLEQAAESCRYGYDVIDSDRETRAAMVNGNLMVAQRKEIFIACRLH